MKIKNMKVMLLGLLAVVGITAFAAEIVVPADETLTDETGRSVNNIVYNLVTIKKATSYSAATGKWEYEYIKEAYVQGVNFTADDADVETLEIPATVTGEKGEYKVVSMVPGWAKVEGMKDVTEITTSLSIDVTNFKEDGLPADAYSDFAVLESLKIIDNGEGLISEFDGSECAFKETLTNLDLTESKISSIADNGLAGFTALTSFDFGENITSVGEGAFAGDYGFTELTIPATVTKIGDDAFADMYNAEANVGLETLTINGCNKDGDVATIPNAFSGNTLLTTLTIGSTIATEIEAEAFAGDVDLETIDLSGATALATIGEGAFEEGLALVTVKLAGTALDALTGIDFSGSKETLETLTFPAGIDNEDLTAAQFQGFVALTEIDLSETGVTAIPQAWCEIEGDAENALTTVKLSEDTEVIGDWAFAGRNNLTSIEGLNQENLVEVKEHAFRKVGLTTLDLSATSLTAIPGFAFEQMANLTTVSLPASVTRIETAAFFKDTEVASINLEDLEGLTVLNPIFHSGVVGGEDSDAEEFAIELATLELPEGLETIEDGALQLLDITDIEIPATVTSLGSRALQGCINLKNFTWNDAKQRTLTTSTFLGDMKLESVKMITMNPEEGYSPIEIFDDGVPEDAAVDKIFKGNKKSTLVFTVNTEDLAVLQSWGWTNANLIYCTLSSVGASKFAFNEKAKAGEYYYKTYYNEEQATWFPAENFEVFSAVVEGANVVLKAANVEEGYYKVAKYDGNNRKEAVCIVRSKQLEAEYELKNADFNDVSTLPTDNGLKVSEGFAASRLKYQYKLGLKGGVLAFYRIASGEFAEGTVYIDAEDPKDRLDIVFEGEATAIQGVATKVAENKGAIYNLNGVRVSKAQKGVYVQDGKKYIK
jgi:Leucine-rich repeat (LRR) protein